MAAIIRIVGLATSETTSADGMYVTEYTPDGNDGQGMLTLTPHRHAAKRYSSKADAMAQWMAVSRTHPTRPDGKPNRPMSAFSVEVTNA